MDKVQYEVIRKKIWFKLLVDGTSKFYTSHEVVDRYVNLLEPEGFDTYYFECNDWESVESFSGDYGINIVNGKSEPDILPDKEGYIFIFKNFEQFFTKNSVDAIRVINIVEDIASHYLLFWKKLLILLNCSGNMFNRKILEANLQLINPIKMIDRDFS